ncbi:MAG: twitching motility protein PilT [Candidatus Bathyarchaeota archaeon B63]|nr:MAG: twitching motility protein PilT [Candidatus Bathyarchaeota archaeon B63]
MRVFIDSNLLVYLNTLTTENIRRAYENFYLNIAAEHRMYTDVLVLDEVIYVSKKRYLVPYVTTLSFIESIVLPYVIILPLSEDEYNEAAEIIGKYNVKPSDALHVGAMRTNDIGVMVSEDEELDRIDEIKRMWI